MAKKKTQLEIFNEVKNSIEVKKQVTNKETSKFTKLMAFMGMTVGFLLSLCVALLLIGGLYWLVKWIFGV